MLLSLTTLLTLSPLFTFSLPTSNSLNRRSSVTSLLELEAALATLETSNLLSPTNPTKIISSYTTFFESITPQSPPPTTIPEIHSLITSIYSTPPTSTSGDAILGIAQMVLSNLLPSTLDPTSLVSDPSNYPAFQDENNSYNNTNPISPPYTIYPQASPSDAPYSLPESVLRAAIKIPDSFSYGKSGKQPIIMVHGTGQTGGLNFLPNLGKLLGNTTYADPVWLNIPSMLNQDAQVSAEYIAYALNYITSITSSPINILSWSQGNVDTQWALKYWPSTRSNVKNFLSLSPDFGGTYEILICPGFPLIPCAPGPTQQIDTSNFITTLRSEGGDSALVPTTVIYSQTDESVEPQPDGEGASSWLGDKNGVGVSNSRVQDVCRGRVAGGVVTHSGVLFNALTWALVKDALVNGGPGDVGRVDLESVCGQVAAEGLGVEDVLVTQGLLAYAVVKILEYPEKVVVEPGIMGYAS